MTADNLREARSDVINARESYPSDSTSRKAIALDEAYLRIDDMINMLDCLAGKIRAYIMDDTVRKENFTDVEICCEDDNEYANEALDEIIGGYTWNDCQRYLKEEELDIADLS